MAESSTSPTSTKRHSAFYNFVFKGLKSPGLLRRITRHPTTGGAEQAPRSSPERNVKDDHNSSVSSQLYHDDSGVFQAQETSADNDQSSSARGMSTGISSYAHPNASNSSITMPIDQAMEESDSQITAPTEQQLREDSEAIIRNMYGTTESACTTSLLYLDCVASESGSVGRTTTGLGIVSEAHVAADSRSWHGKC